MGDGMARIALGWNHAYGSFIGDLLPDFGAAVSFVGNAVPFAPLPNRLLGRAVSLAQLNT